MRRLAPIASGTTLKTALGIAFHNSDSSRFANREDRSLSRAERDGKLFIFGDDCQIHAQQGKLGISSPPTPVAKDGGDVACVTTVEWTDSAETELTRRSHIQTEAEQPAIDASFPATGRQGILGRRWGRNGHRSFS